MGIDSDFQRVGARGEKIESMDALSVRLPSMNTNSFLI